MIKNPYSNHNRVVNAIRNIYLEFKANPMKIFNASDFSIQQQTLKDYINLLILFEIIEPVIARGKHGRDNMGYRFINRKSFLHTSLSIEGLGQAS